MAKASAAQAAASRIWSATANPDGPGLLEHGREFEPTPASDFDPFIVEAALRLARLSDKVAEALRDCPDASVRRSAALLAARAHPVQAAFDVT